MKKIRVFRLILYPTLFGGVNRLFYPGMARNGERVILGLACEDREMLSGNSLAQPGTAGTT